VTRSNEPKYAERCARLRTLSAQLSLEASAFERRTRVVFDPSAVGVEDAFTALELHLHNLRTIASAICETVVTHQKRVRA